ncbi:MAG: protein kinase [Schlesneria sp.]
MVADCPDVELLEAFLDGRGSEQLVEHVAECSSCAARMESLLELERDRIFEASTKDPRDQYLNESKYEELKKWTRFLTVNSTARVPADNPETIGRYQVRRFLGKGSFGDVYAVYDPLFDIERAVKLLRRGLFDSESSRNQFLAEARHAVKVSHPGLVDVRDVVIDPDQSFIVMKLIDGETLEKRLRRGPVEIATTVQIMTKAAQAANHAHEAGLVHRDLKPANILLDQHQNPVIADFGLVIDQRVLSEVDRSTPFAGTRPYMSPEQYSETPLAIDRRSDIWALGVVLAEMLQRERPFPQRDHNALSHAIRTEEPVLPKGKQFAELNGILKRCLAKKPDHRYATAAELANDLHGWSRRHSPKWYVRWQYGWRRNLAMGICLLLMCGAAWAGQSWASRDKIDRMIGNLESAPASLIPRRVSDLVAIPGSREILKGRPFPLDAAAKFRVNLAFAACDGDRAELWTDLADYVQTVSVPLNEIGAALESLRETPRCSELVNVAVSRLLEKRPDDSPSPRETVLRLSAVVAGLSPDDQVWPKIKAQIAHDLVRVSEPEFDHWLDFFQAVGTSQLSADLTSQMTSPDESREIQLRSARALAAFFKDAVGQPVELLIQADWDELEPLLKALRTNPDLAVEVLRERFGRLRDDPRPIPADDEELPSEHDMQTARLAVALWQLGDHEAVCQALRHDPDPTLQTLVIFGLSKQPIKVNDVVTEVDRVRNEKDEHTDGIVFGLLQVLCLRKPASVEAVSLDWLDQLFQEERDSGVHSMIRLLAKRSGYSLIQPQPGQYGSWRVEKIGEANVEFVVIDRPVFQAGILDRKAKAYLNEAWKWHRRSIPRRFAIGMCEITFDEFRQFKPGYGDREGLHVAGDAAAVPVSRENAFAFCNWCSDRAGLPHCYEREETGGELIPVPNHLELPGYRLPTEGEWECACRAGTETGRFFGQISRAENRLYDYAWQDGTPEQVLFNGTLISQHVGRLLPNRWGLFDTYGNVRELCEISTPVDETAQVTFDEAFEKPDGIHDANGISGIMRTLVRGTCVTDLGLHYAYSHLRSEMFVYDPSCGIRLARTLVERGRD